MTALQTKLFDYFDEGREFLNHRLSDNKKQIHANKNMKNMNEVFFVNSEILFLVGISSRARGHRIQLKSIGPSITRKYSII